jgi:hypothetical protein
MLAPATFPKWLPPSVKIEAERILGGGHADEALVLRLATDGRMQRVWRELPKHKRPHPQIREAWTTLMDNRVDVSPPQDVDVHALFFWCAYTIASLGVAAGIDDGLDKPIAKYLLVANGLRLAAARLRSFWLRGEPVSADIHIENIEAAAHFYKRVVDELIELKTITAPLVVKRDHGNREARGYVRMLAIETRDLFGSTLYRTLATVASVALMKDVKASQVTKWCQSLDD